MGLADDLANLEPKPRHKPLAIDRVLATLEPADHEALIAALRDDNLPASLIASALIRNGHAPVGDMDQAVRTWRARNRDAR